jgi:predicted metal-binding membrane protein
LLGGAFQFSPLKHACLKKCRSPFSFVIEHWRGRRERWQALSLCIGHGIFCVGCCWALMLLMFAVGAGNLIWMLILALLMAVEKNIRWGRRLSAPIGTALLVWGAVLMVFRNKAWRGSVPQKSARFFPQSSPTGTACCRVSLPSF